MKHSTIRTIAIILLILHIGFFFLFPATSASALSAGESDGSRIRVAQIDASNFYDYDRYGPIGGYGYEYLKEIANYTGWEYQYVPVTWEQGLEMLESGKLDLLAPAPACPELQRRFNYSEKEIGVEVFCSLRCGGGYGNRCQRFFRHRRDEGRYAEKRSRPAKALKLLHRKNEFRIEPVPYGQSGGFA